MFRDYLRLSLPSCILDFKLITTYLFTTVFMSSLTIKIDGFEEWRTFGNHSLFLNRLAYLPPFSMRRNSQWGVAEWTIQGSFSKPRRWRQRKRHTTKELMSKTMAVHVRYNFCYYISNSVRAPLLVNLAGRTLRHGSLKFKAVSIAKLLRDLRYDLWPARFALRP